MLTTHVDGSGGTRPDPRPDVVRAGDRFEIVSGVPDRATYLERLASRPGTVVVEARAFATVEPHALAEIVELRDAIAQHRAARADADRAAAGLAEARAAHDQVRDRRRAAEAAIREGRAQLAALEVRTLSEPEVRRRLELHRAQLTDAEAAVAAAAAQVADERRAVTAALATVAATVEDLYAERARIEAGEPDPVDRDLDEVAEALARLDAAAASAGPSPRGIALAGEWAALASRIARLEGARPAPVSDRMLAIAREQVASARAALADAQHALHTVGDAQRARLDALHAAVEQAESAVRSGGRDAITRLATARRAERAALEEAGFASHAEYLLAASAGDPAGRLRVWSAERALALAEEDLERVERTRRPDPELAAAYQRREALRAEAVSLLGGDPGAEIEERLRHHPDVDPALLARLARALQRAGIDPGAEPLDDVARRVVAANQAARALARSRSHRLAEIDERIAGARAELDRLSSAAEAAVRAADAAREEAERRRLDVAAAVAALEATLTDRLEDAIDADAADAADALRARIDAVQSALERATGGERAAADVEAAERTDADARVRLARSDARLRHLLARAEPGGEGRDPDIVLARLEQRLAAEEPGTGGLDRLAAHVEALCTGPNTPSTIVIDLPMTVEEGMAGDHARRFADLARTVQIVWVAR
jgi:hypothetical protein